MALVDEVQLDITAGNGGDGVVRWRTEKFKPKGGPCGGNGGAGGSVIAEAVADLAYLDFYLRKKNFSAQHGEPGGSNSKEGKNGEDLVLKFPRGSVITNQSTGEVVDLAEVGDQVTLLRGGKGGLGNEHFKSSTNTTPYEWTPGTPGEEAHFNVELRLFADAGFVGLPSAGKSTLLNALTNAKSKVGAYHFTTLDPHLGEMHGHILADIPGIIEGASEGKGLGHKFLRHIRRTREIIHVVAADSEDPAHDYQVIRTELERYDQDLADKDEIILISKTDLVDEKTLEMILKDLAKVSGHDRIYTYSAYDQDSIDQFKKVLTNHLQK
ncbi:GTPase ObgE [Patescibacteria group bacterium]|nr:GTPase ObgE [Patescibacteria group bacterium]